MLATIWANLLAWAAAKTKTFWLGGAIGLGLFLFGGCCGCACSEHMPHWFFSPKPAEAAGEKVFPLDRTRTSVSNAALLALMAQQPGSPYPYSPARQLPCDCQGRPFARTEFVLLPPAGDWHPAADGSGDSDYWEGSNRTWRYFRREDTARAWHGADLSAEVYTFDYTAKEFKPVATESDEPPLAP
jgi:hypothetical protein